MGLCDGSRALGAARRGFVVWRPLQQHRKRTVLRRTIDIRRQADAVPGHYDEIPIDNHLAPGHIHATFPVLAGPSALSFAPRAPVKGGGLADPPVGLISVHILTI